mgnify:CR=1 FL=1
MDRTGNTIGKVLIIGAAGLMSVSILCAWESKLFPRTEQGYEYATASDGYRLPDFSYAGYHGGDKEIPAIETAESISSSGSDDTAAIQKAVDEMKKPGALLLRAGTYIVTDEIVLPPGAVLRGEGTNRTFIFVKTTDFRSKAAIVGYHSAFTKQKRSVWSSSEPSQKSFVDQNIARGASVIPVARLADFPEGSWVVVKNEIRKSESNPLREEYNGTSSDGGTLLWPSDWVSFKFMRKVVRHENGSLVLDHGIRHLLQTRDFAQVMEAPDMGEEIGVEDLSIGFLKPDDHDTYHSLTSAGEKSSYHFARAVSFGNVRNGWIVRVASYIPEGGVHLLSCGIGLEHSKWITVKDCVMQDPVNLGGGANGYGFLIYGADECLVLNSTGIDCRHNFMLTIAATGNVITGCTSVGSRYGDDSHQGLACENLIDDIRITAPSAIGAGFIWGIQNRGKTSAGAGQCGADNVFWRVFWDDNRFPLISDQAEVNGSAGYVIGVSKVKENIQSKREWREGIGDEANLMPRSLWQEQLKLRKKSAD